MWLCQCVPCYVTPSRDIRSPTARQFGPVTRRSSRPDACSWVCRTLVLAAIARRAGLPPIRLHNLRHGTATHALSAEVDLKTVSEMLGHSSTIITADTCTSVADELKHAAADKIAD